MRSCSCSISASYRVRALERRAAESAALRIEARVLGGAEDRRVEQPSLVRRDLEAQMWQKYDVRLLEPSRRERRDVGRSARRPIADNDFVKRHQMTTSP